MNAVLTDRERLICIIALSNLDSLLESPDPSLEYVAHHIREFLRKHGMHKQDIKDLAVKLGVPERSVFSASKDLR
jgi:hypothetical protein